MKGQSILEELKDIQNGAELNIIVTYREFNKDTKQVQTKARQFVVKDFGLETETIFHTPEQTQRPVLVR